MKYRLIAMLVFCTCSFSEAQTYIENRLFYDDFTNNSNSWSIVQHSAYNSKISNGNYICNLQRDNTAGWRWTYVGLPDELSVLFNETNDDITLSFDYYYLEENNPDHFGFIFDIHNVTDGCPGGDGYSLIFDIDSDDDSVIPQFFGTRKCNSETTNFIEGFSTPLKKQNRIIINKIGFNWNILINDKLVLNLKITGNISIDRLKFGYGKHIFDNFKIFSRNLNASPTQLPNNTEKPSIWALCVGINDYSKHPGYPESIRNLSSSSLDAKRYFEFLKSFNSGLVPKENIKVLLDKEATRDKILNSITSHLAKAGPNDLVILFLSGHGGPNSYFCASDGNLRYSDINKALGTSSSTKKLLLADACHSGNWATSKNTVGAKGITYTDEEALEMFYRELANANANITYILASKPDEYSWENLADENNNRISGGTFTHYLIKGLSCEAKNNTTREPIIYVEDIYNYLYKKISTIHVGQYYIKKETGEKLPVTPQHPVINPQANLKMPVAICNN